MIVCDIGLLAEAAPHVVEHVGTVAQHAVEHGKHGGIGAWLHHVYEHGKEIALKDFVPGFVGYWLHTINHGGWHRLWRHLPRFMRGSH